MWWTWIIQMLFLVIGPLAIQVLKSIGVGVVTFLGVELLITGLKSRFYDELGKLPVAILDIISLMNVDIAVNIIFSAIVARAVLGGMMSGSKKTYAWNPPGRNPVPM